MRMVKNMCFGRNPGLLLHRLKLKGATTCRLVDESETMTNPAAQLMIVLLESSCLSYFCHIFSISCHHVNFSSVSVAQSMIDGPGTMGEDKTVQFEYTTLHNLENCAIKHADSS